MGIVHLGGAISWHNNHHAHPAYFYVKRKWWEFDAHYMTLRILESLGAVSNIKVKIDLDDCKNTKAH
jgi:stearoyl-CoA desaturase (delta-9 desaturase)